MTENLAGMSSLKKTVQKSQTAQAEQAAVRELVKAARARGEDLTGPEGLLKTLTKTVLETGLDEEMNDHLGYDKHAVEGRGSGNSRNGTRTKTVTTDNVGAVDIEVPRDREGSFEPKTVRKRQRRLGDVDTVVLSLYAKGLTTGEISAHFAEVYGASVSKDRVSVITDRVLEDMQAWCARPLLPVYAAIFIDAIHVKVRDGQVGNRPFYAAIGVDLQGRRDVLGLWAGTAGHGESAKFWMSVLTEIKNRGVGDVFFIVCDAPVGPAGRGQPGLPTGYGPDLHHPPHPRHVPVRLEEVLGPHRPRPAPDLHGALTAGRVGRVRGVRGEMGQGLPGDIPTVARRVGAVHPVPGL
ncbi:transposase-like protein [Janibacter cremeus]|uniref:Mutator family transposase n=1 Tax=Janibacter cremeus TaxID=1285192 RepID=A0A852VVX5_9MICO|nr:transposase-like protein [Janibacter cremeus]NYF99688.1 transposase-like protein [Janibacter cremeus]